MRERERESHTLCLSLSQLGDLYPEMLKLDEAERTAQRMLREARRYDTDNQTRIANEILRDVAKDRSLGLLYGTPVKIHSSIGQAGLNGHVGEVRGESQSSLLRPAFLEPPPPRPRAPAAFPSNVVASE